MSIPDYLRRLSGRLNPFSSHASGEEPEEPEPVTALPDGYREATVGIEDFDSPETFDHSEYDIHCDLCGDDFPSYWGWFEHGRDEHSFASIGEARKHTTITVPEGFEESDNPDFDAEPGDGLHAVPFETPGDGEESDGR